MLKASFPKKKGEMYLVHASQPGRVLKQEKHLHFLYYTGIIYSHSLLVEEESSDLHEGDEQGGPDGEGEDEVWREAAHHDAHADGGLVDKHGDEDGDEEVLGGRVQPNHPVEDAHEEDGGEEDEGHVGQLLAHEVGVRAVEAVVVLSDEHGDLAGEDLKQ